MKSTWHEHNPPEDDDGPGEYYDRKRREAALLRSLLVRLTDIIDDPVVQGNALLKAKGDDFQRVIKRKLEEAYEVGD